MAAAGVVFHRLAAREYREARNWYARRSPSTSRRFLLAVDRVLQKILAHPDRWPWYDDRHQWVKVARFPYLLLFRTLADNWIVIVAVAHAHRRPGYWKRRSV